MTPTYKELWEIHNGKEYPKECKRHEHCPALHNLGYCILKIGRKCHWKELDE